MIYLAIPYTSMPSKSFKYANKVSGILLQAGHHVFSPISHSHPIAQQSDLPKEYSFWNDWNKHFLKNSSLVLAVSPDGDYNHIKQSTGVQGELRLARKLKIPVRYTSYPKDPFKIVQLVEHPLENPPS